MSIERYLIFRTSLLWFIWAISVLHMVWFSGPFHALRCRSGSAGRCLLRSSLGGFAVVQQLSAIVAARGPFVEGKAATVSPDAANATQTGGGGGEGSGVDQGFVLQASDNDELVEPAATGTAWPGA